MKTFTAKPADIRHSWYLVDASEKTLGRLATAIAVKLRGKHKPEYTQNLDSGDYVVVINAGKVRVTGRKASNKMYYRYSGYPGGIKSSSFEKLLATKPERIIETAVKGMLPKGPLGRAMFRKLKVYRGNDHKHSAQQPIPLEV
jgi:large subunit ribosomal protein L13